MELCVLAKIVLLLSIIIIAFETCAYGMSIISILFDILFTAFIVFIANSYCDFWIAKGLVIFSLFFTVIAISMCVAKQKMHKMLIEDELNRQKQQK